MESKAFDGIRMGNEVENFFWALYMMDTWSRGLGGNITKNRQTMSYVLKFEAIGRTLRQMYDMIWESEEV